MTSSPLSAVASVSTTDCCDTPSCAALARSTSISQVGAAGLDAVVHVDDVGRVPETLGDHAGRLDLAFVVLAVDFSDQRRQHRRAGRNFDNLDVAAERPRDCLQGIVQRTRDLMALAFAVVLVDEIYLNVALVGVAAQVILANQPLKLMGAAVPA